MALATGPIGNSEDAGQVDVWLSTVRELAAHGFRRVSELATLVGRELGREPRVNAP